MLPGVHFEIVKLKPQGRRLKPLIHCFEMSTTRGAPFLQEGDLVEKLKAITDLAILREARIQFECNAVCGGGSQ